MLGRIKRTSRLDVGLALTFVGIAFLAWSFVAGTSRVFMARLIQDATCEKAMELPNFTAYMRTFFVETGFVIDIAGLAWMLLSLSLVFFASRQKYSISWAWVSATMQILVAGLGGMLVAGAAIAIYTPGTPPPPSIMQKISQVSWPVVLAIAIFLFILFLIKMLSDRAKLINPRPTLSDSWRSNQ